MKVLTLLFCLIPFLGFSQISSNITASMVKYDVVYRGIETPLNINVAGIPANEITLKSSDGTITGENGTYRVKPGRGRKFVIQILHNGTVIDSIVTQVKNIPDPYSYFGSFTGDVNTSIAEIIEIGCVEARIPNFQLKLDFNVLSFNVVFQSIDRKTKKKTLRKYENPQPCFTQEVIAALRSQDIDGTIYLNDILIEFDVNGNKRTGNVRRLILRLGDEIQNQLDAERQLVSERDQQIFHKDAQLSDQQAELDSLDFAISSQTEKLAEGAKELEAQNDKIKEQAETLGSQIIQIRNYKIILILAFLVAIFISILLYFIYRGYLEKKKANLLLSQQKVEIEEAHREITDSIIYAQRIQTAILPPTKLVKSYLSKSFVLYKPKDIVAGDFYWMDSVGDTVLFAACDCTGHGVPGAMVSVLCNNALNRAVKEYGLQNPGEILDMTRKIVIAEFEKSEEDVKDGMDASICSLTGHKLRYAGANNPLWIIRNGAIEVEEIKAHKEPIGRHVNPTPFTTHEIELNEGDTFYIFSDGFADQFGGDKGKKLKSKAFKEFLISIQNKAMDKQRSLADSFFENWKGNYEQVDDVCLIGVRI
ncbi:MAG: GldM family protein [Flavobacteriales bacterium]